MIVSEIIDYNGRELLKTYSDENFTIRKIGTDEVYSEAVDVPESTFACVETDEEIATVEINKEKD